jgi:hypothetical protein
MTLPEPARPYLIPKKEETIKEILSRELPKINFRLETFRLRGFLRKYKIGKKERLTIKKRQKTMTSTGSSAVRIFKAVQPPPHKNIESIRR